MERYMWTVAQTTRLWGPRFGVQILILGISDEFQVIILILPYP